MRVGETCLAKPFHECHHISPTGFLVNLELVDEPPAHFADGPRSFYELPNAGADAIEAVEEAHLRIKGDQLVVKLREKWPLTTLYDGVRTDADARSLATTIAV